ncbi:MAG: transposase [Bacteroidetes bacterium]|nr:MAG: transposase [Bacteroidota bacterium]
MSRKYKFHDQEQLYFDTCTLVKWLDLFIRNEYKEILIDSWQYCINKKGLDLYGWCIMTSHTHMIIGTHGEPMQNIMRDFKKFTSNKLIQAIIENPQESRKEWLLNIMKDAGESNSNNKKYQLWQQDSHPIELYDNKITHQKLDYTHDNPVTAGFVSKPEDWLYSSARDYAGEKGLIKIEIIEPLLEL